MQLRRAKSYFLRLVCLRLSLTLAQADLEFIRSLQDAFNLLKSCLSAGINGESSCARLLGPASHRVEPAGDLK